MSAHSNQSSAGAGQASSSPVAGTDPTNYSPVAVRPPVINRPPAAGVPLIAPVSTVPYGSLPPAAPYVEGAFVNEIDENAPDFTSRFLAIDYLPYAPQCDDKAMDMVTRHMKLYECYNNAVLIVNDGLFVRFDDLNHAANGKTLLEQHGFGTRFISSWDFARVKKQDTMFENEFEGQIKLSIDVRPLSHLGLWQFPVEKDHVYVQAINVASKFGDVRSIVHVGSDNVNFTLHFRVEFFSVDAANRAVHSLRRLVVSGRDIEGRYDWSVFDATLWTGERARSSPHRHKPRLDDQGRIYGYAAASTNSPREDRHGQDDHNLVDRERVLQGLDIRTSIMIRNIPNKMDWLALKAIVDRICFGKYDFFYLRIDFETGCNVGYAFVNLVDTSSLVSLIDQLQGHPWAGYRSSKEAELSYAVIQGLENLITKFRNSSVMQETQYCRPRLFVTEDQAQMAGMVYEMGKEHKFPEPDNIPKLTRSIQTAKTTGLYPPRGGLNADNGRLRASNFDRGTPRDLLATQQVRQPTSPVVYGSISSEDKDSIERWYSERIASVAGRVPLDSIPLDYILRWYSDFKTTPQGLGPIGSQVPVTPLAGSSSIHTPWLRRPATGSTNNDAAGSTDNGVPETPTRRGQFAPDRRASRKVFVTRPKDAGDVFTK